LHPHDSGGIGLVTRVVKGKRRKGWDGKRENGKSKVFTA